MSDNLDTAINDLEAAYDKVLKRCYDALSADATQETRDALRAEIEQFISQE